MVAFTTEVGGVSIMCSKCPGTRTGIRSTQRQPKLTPMRGMTANGIHVLLPESIQESCHTMSASAPSTRRRRGNVVITGVVA